jgi:transcriptional regulator with PAS, ATPase and Fis domain
MSSNIINGRSLKSSPREKGPLKNRRSDDGLRAILGQDPKLLSILETVAQVADTDATVLIQGESGTGKELVARSIHRRSTRRESAFVAVNCGAVPESLLESEVFGHARGAFTGADTTKVGKFEAANRGTIFLDELSEMGRPLQVSLLRLLQSGEYTPVGAVESRYSDARVVSATNVDLIPLIESGRFRRDLYYRLNIIRIELPPLRNRRDDIPVLIDHFLATFCAAYGRPALGLGPDARDLLLQYSYPGNVRELENIIRRAVILSDGDTIRARDLSPEIVAVPTAAPVPPPSRYHEAKHHAIRVFEESYLSTALRNSGGIVSRAARLTGLSERNFHKKLARYHIDFKVFRR